MTTTILPDPDPADLVVIDPDDPDAWDALWPLPDRAAGDGSDRAESAANDGTPGAVA